ncbi:MAG: hypothetical protein RSC00_08590 [Ruthenibacterium sp.]
MQEAADCAAFGTAGGTVLSARAGKTTYTYAIAQNAHDFPACRPTLRAGHFFENHRKERFVYSKTIGDYFNLTINEAEAAIVREIFDFYTSKALGAALIAGA